MGLLRAAKVRGAPPFFLATAPSISETPAAQFLSCQWDGHEWMAQEGSWPFEDFRGAMAEQWLEESGDTPGVKHVFFPMVLHVSAPSLQILKKHKSTEQECVLLSCATT